MDETWTLPELVVEVGARLARLPVPKNGQVRAVPDERSLRYYSTIGLLDRPVSMRGRTALYGRRHLAQVVAIKRLQAAGSTLAEIQTLWPTLDDAALQRMTGVEIPDANARRARARYEFWKHEPTRSTTAPAPMPVPLSLPHAKSSATAVVMAAATAAAATAEAAAAAAAEAAAVVASGARTANRSTNSVVATAPITVTLDLAPHLTVTITMPASGLALTPADVRALRAAAAPLVAELAARGLTQENP